jgi:DNA-binding beta-propeller fold protein YncE
MGRWGTGLACLILLFVFLAVDGDAQEQPPSLEFIPSTEVVPDLRERVRTQPKTLFTKTLGGFGIGRRSFDAPVDVTHDKEGNYYVLDAGNSRIQKFSDRDHFELEWGRSGSAKGEFKDPRAIVNVDLPQSLTFQTEDGDSKRTDALIFVALGSLGAASGKFNGPTDIAFDGDGNIYVLDTGNSRIQKFDASGSFVDEWGRFRGGRSGDFSRLHSIAWFDERFGFLYMLGEGEEEGTCLVQILTLQKGREEVENSWIVTFPYDNVETCIPTRMEIDNWDEYVYILDDVNNVIRRFHTDGRYLDSIWEADELFNGPMGFSVQEQSRKVWIADTGNNTVQRFSLR